MLGTMNPIPAWLGAAVLLGSLAAQDAPVSKPDLKTRLVELQKEQQRIVAAWRQAAVAAQKAAETAAASGTPIPAMSMEPDFGALRSTTLAAAKDYVGDEQCSLLVFAFRTSKGEAEYGEILDLLRQYHVKSAVLAELSPSLAYLPQLAGARKATEFLTALERDAVDPGVLGWVVYAKHGPTLETADAKSPEFQSAKAALTKAAASSGDPRLQSRIQATLVEKEHFAIGVTAPEIEGSDLDGVAFKLSDYRGKVVFVDFWGDW